MRGRGVIFGVAVLIVVGLAGCGSTSPRRVVVRVKGVPITQPMLERWTRILAAGQQSSGVSSGVRRREALAFLISSEWLVGEAADEGLAVSDRDSERGLRERTRGYPGGDAEFTQVLALKGEARADALFRIKRELAMQGIREKLRSKEHKVASSQVSAYYEQTPRRFRVAERRQVLLAYSNSRAEAERAKREAEAGSAVWVGADGGSFVYTRGLYP